MDALPNPPQLLRILFFICEALTVASFAVNELLWRRFPRDTHPSAAFGFVFLISLAALLVVCFCLRRRARRLAVTGWITAFVLFWYGALTPNL